MTPGNKIRQQIDLITLDDMRLEIGLEEAILQDSDQAGRITAIWMVQRFFFNHPGLRKDKLNAKDVLVQAKYFALEYLMNKWDDLGKGATTVLLNDASQNPWQSEGMFSYQTLENLLADVMDNQTEITGISVWKFVIEQLLPAAKKFGISPAQLCGATTQQRKLRVLIPVAREILSNEGLTQDEKEADLRKFVSKAADREINATVLNAEAQEYRTRKRHNIQIKIDGYESIMPNGETWIVVKCPTPLDERLVEIQLQNKVDIRVTPWTTFSAQIALMLKDAKNLTEEERQILEKLLKESEEIHGESPDIRN